MDSASRLQPLASTSVDRTRMAPSEHSALAWTFGLAWPMHSRALQHLTHHSPAEWLVANCFPQENQRFTSFRTCVFVHGSVPSVQSTSQAVPAPCPACSPGACQSAQLDVGRAARRAEPLMCHIYAGVKSRAGLLRVESTAGPSPNRLGRSGAGGRFARGSCSVSVPVHVHGARS